ncbi:MAG: HIT family protein [Deltaproteobacteria bacterium]|nr:HIT family protein [Deltaproteobacteria bacterium]
MNILDCPFCSGESREQIVDIWSSVFALEDKYPVTSGHHLIVPFRHTRDFFTMTAFERRDAEVLLFRIRRRLLEKDPGIVGFNVGLNCGEVAGQTIMHAHIHLIPRREGDDPEPVGGIRGVIPDKKKYF